MSYDRAVETLLGGALEVLLNMSDTFAYACADAEEMDVDDFMKAWPIISEYGQHALTAYVAVKRRAEPLQKYQTDAYRKAKEAFLELRSKVPEFMSECE